MIHTIDCQYLFPQYAASFLIVENGRAAFVEANTNACVPILLQSLDQTGLKPSDVDWVVVTHAHLDHAGGAALLLKHLPNARLLAHPKAARHLCAPDQLVASARAVYGDRLFQQLYGDIQPVPRERVVETGEGMELRWGDSQWEILHTPGHAAHHLCLFDHKAGHVFTGDTFGICYPKLQRNGLFILPSTSPTGFEPEKALHSLERIRQCGARTAYLTHFGPLRQLDAAAQVLCQWLDWSRQLRDRLVESGLQGDALLKCAETEVDTKFQQVMDGAGLTLAEDWELLAGDRKLNAAGIAVAAERIIRISPLKI